MTPHPSQATPSPQGEGNDKELLPPRFGGEEDEHGEDFEAAEEHVKAQDCLTYYIKPGNAHGEGVRVDAVADVAEAGDRSEHAVADAQAVYRQHHSSQNDRHEIRNGKAFDRGDRVLLDDLAVKVDKVHGVRRDGARNGAVGALGEDHHARQLHAAARRAGHGAGYHQNGQHSPNKGRPEACVDRHIAGRADDGNDLEQSVVNAVGDGREFRGSVDAHDAAQRPARR